MQNYYIFLKSSDHELFCVGRQFLLNQMFINCICLYSFSLHSGLSFQSFGNFLFSLSSLNCSPYCSYSDILLLFWCNNVSVSHYIVVNKRGSQLFQFSSHKDSIEEVEVLGIDKVQRGMNFQTLHQYSGVP